MSRITSIGEILFDMYPGFKSIGGAPFNFLFHIKKLTGDGIFVSRVGADIEGEEILSFLRRNGISTDYVQIDQVHPTGESVAALNEHKIPSWKIKTETAYDFIEQTRDLNHLIEDETYCLYYGTLAQRNIMSRETIHNFFNKKLKYFCDLNIRENFYSKDLIEKCISAANVLKLNIDELRLVNELILKKNFNSETPKRLLQKFQLEVLCVTHGDKGANIYKENELDYFKANIVDVIDTVGAGDAYAAILCIGYLKNWDIGKINKIASEFAGEIVRINGALPTVSELYDKYKEIINE